METLIRVSAGFLVEVVHVVIPVIIWRLWWVCPWDFCTCSNPCNHMVTLVCVSAGFLV